MDADSLKKDNMHEMLDSFLLLLRIYILFRTWCLNQKLLIFLINEPFKFCKYGMYTNLLQTFMYISDVLDPSIFCRKMEKANVMREEMDGKVFLPVGVGFSVLRFNQEDTFSYLYHDSACKHFCFPPSISLSGRNESAK